MLAGTAGGGQVNNRLKPYSVIQWSLVLVKKNKLQKDAEAHYHFSEFISLFFLFVCLHQIEQTYIGTCKVNTLWCFSLPSKPQINKDWISIFLFFLYSKHENTLKYLQKKYTYNAHHSNIVIIWDWFESVKQKYCVWQSLLFKVIKSTAREKEAQKKKKSLKNNTKQKIR